MLGATETSSRSDHCRSLAVALLLLLLTVSSARFDGAGSSIELLVFVEFASSSVSSTEFCVAEPVRSTSATVLETSVRGRLTGEECVCVAGARILSSCDASDDCGGGARLFKASINRFSHSVCFPACMSSFVKLISGSAFSCKYMHSGLKHFRLFKKEEQYFVVPSDAFTNLPSSIEL